MFRTACHVGDDDQKDQGLTNKIASSQLFNYIMRFCLKNMGKVFNKLLGRSPGTEETQDENSGKNQDEKEEKDEEITPLGRPVTEFKRWKTILPCVKSFFGHMLHFLSQAADASLIRYVLASLKVSLPFLLPFPRFTKKFVKYLLSVWTGSDHNARIDAFLRLRQLALANQDLRETVIQNLYISFVRHAKYVDQHTFPALRFMVNCVVEIIGLDPVTGFQHGFVYIRQLAIHLRNALNTKAALSAKSVYNWQFINSLRVWAHVLAAHAQTHKVLEGLVYPFVQVCMAVLGLSPTTKYFPLRFQIVRFLHTLISAYQPGELFVPLAPYLASVLSAPELAKPPSKSTAANFDLQYALHAPDSVISTRSFQTACVDEALELLLEHFSLLSTAVAFPELIVPTKLALKKVKKTHRMTKVKTGITQLLGKLDLNAQWIVSKRAKIEYSPKDMAPGSDISFTALLQANNSGQSPLQRYSPTNQNQSAEKKKKSETTAEDMDTSEDDEGSENEEEVDEHALLELAEESSDEEDDDMEHTAQDTVTDLVLSDDSEQEADSDSEEDLKQGFEDASDSSSADSQDDSESD